MDAPSVADGQRKGTNRDPEKGGWLCVGLYERCIDDMVREGRWCLEDPEKLSSLISWSQVFYDPLSIDSAHFL